MRARSIPVGALVLAVLAGVWAPARGRAQTRELHLASTPWPPFTNTPGKARFALDLVDAALTRIGVKADTTIVDERELTPALLSGKFDGSAALWRDAEREQKLLYSRPYLQNRLVLVGRNGTDVSATTMAGLAGKRVALVEGYSYGEGVSAATGVVLVPSGGVEDSLQKVLSSEVDYTLMEELVVEYLTATYPNEVKTRLALGSTPLIVRSLHLAIRRDIPDAKSIVDRFNAELAKMIADRTYHKLLHVAWIDADIDGDGRTELIPASDQAGPRPPEQRYGLRTDQPADKPAVPPASESRFYIGGQMYNGWGNVPDRYKVGDPNKTPWGSTVVPVFSFKWQ